MKIYRVGGAVRDQLLKLPIKEVDWVVVGATPREMLAKNFRQVGKDFPVFLHPETNEEYALARKERKVSPGYTGFTFETSRDVTLAEDLKRRDITINAMAQAEDGELIDPYHGQADLKNKLLRHVSDAFIEDPVRILRVARFAARFKQYGFTVAPETIKLMQQMVRDGEVKALVSERVWKELERALREANPEVFFAVLQQCDAFPYLFPDHLSLPALHSAVKISDDATIRFAALTQQLSAAEIKKLAEKFRIPTDYRDLALLVNRFQETYRHYKTVSVDELLNLFQGTDAFRREARFKKFLIACIASTGVNQEEFFLALLDELKNIPIPSGLSGKIIGETLLKTRKEIIQKFRANN